MTLWLLSWGLSSFALAQDPREEGTFWMPPQASTLAEDVDFVFYYIYWVSIAFFVMLMGSMIFFFFRYRQKKTGEKTSAIKGNHLLEIGWATLPGLLLVSFFVLGFRTYIDSSIPPKDSMEVRVTGRKWSWSYDYPASGVSSGTLRVPAGEPIKLVMSSVDVLHSYYVPDFRIKKDVLPNRYTVVWFEAPEPGEHTVFCTEYCGNGHSRMLSKVEVMEPREFNRWVKSQQSFDPSALSSAERGQKLYQSKGCAGCHSVDGTPMLGPTLQGLYGKQEPLTDGTTAQVDDNYLRESLMVPAAKVVAGFAAQMPPYQGQLDDSEVNDIIDFIKSISE